MHMEFIFLSRAFFCQQSLTPGGVKDLQIEICKSLILNRLNGKNSQTYLHKIWESNIYLHNSQRFSSCDDRDTPHSRRSLAQLSLFALRRDGFSPISDTAAAVTR